MVSKLDPIAPSCELYSPASDPETMLRGMSKARNSSAYEKIGARSRPRAEPVVALQLQMRKAFVAGFSFSSFKKAGVRYKM